MNKFLLIALSLLFSSSLFAQTQVKTKKKVIHEETTTEQHYGEVPWGQGGCSYWNYVIKDKAKEPQIGVWVLERLLLHVQTFAMSSGTSNCVEGGHHHASLEREQEVFVNVNLANLQKEASQGRGKHLNTLAEIFGCKDKEGFAQLSQTRYEAIFSNESPSSVVESYKAELKSARTACLRAG